MQCIQCHGNRVETGSLKGAHGIESVFTPGGLKQALRRRAVQVPLQKIERSLPVNRMRAGEPLDLALIVKTQPGFIAAHHDLPQPGWVGADKRIECAGPGWIISPSLPLRAIRARNSRRALSLRSTRIMG